jgi:hypothetical protein
MRRVHRDAVDKLLIQPQQPNRERGAAEICKSEIGRDHGGDARRIAG